MNRDDRPTTAAHLERSKAEGPGQPSAAARAVDAIAKMILRRELRAGEPVGQSDMAARLEMSPIPVREALKALEHDGLLEHRHNSGYYVSEYGINELQEIYLIRGLLEAELLKTLNWPSPSAVARYRQLNVDMEEAWNHYDTYAVVELNTAFHMGIYECSPLTLVQREMRRILRMANMYPGLYLTDGQKFRMVLEHHEKIVDALEARDRDALHRAIEAHSYCSRQVPQPGRKRGR